MLNQTAMRELTTRKQRLVTECELTRQTVRAEFLALQAAVGAAAETVKSALSVLRVVLLAAPVAGFFLTRKGSGLKRFVRTTFLA